MRVLGVDPGLTRCGVAIVDAAPGRQVSALVIDCVRTDKDDALETRLLALEEALQSLVERYAPDVVAVERVFSQQNVRSVMGTAQAAAVAYLVAGRAGIAVASHTPTEVKAAITGSGRAEKSQVGEMVRRLLGLRELPKPADAADAAAIAICQAWRGGAQRRLENARIAASGR